MSSKVTVKLSKSLQELLRLILSVCYSPRAPGSANCFVFTSWDWSWFFLPVSIVFRNPRGSLSCAIYLSVGRTVSDWDWDNPHAESTFSSQDTGDDWAIPQVFVSMSALRELCPRNNVMFRRERERLEAVVVDRKTEFGESDHGRWRGRHINQRYFLLEYSQTWQIVQFFTSSRASNPVIQLLASITISTLTLISLLRLSNFPVIPATANRFSFTVCQKPVLWPECSKHEPYWTDIWS